MEPGLYYTFAECNSGVPSSVESFRHELAKFSRNRVLHVCSVINSLLASWTGKLDRQAHELLVRNAFPPPLADRLLIPQSPERIVFHRQQVLFVAKEAVQHCPKVGLDPNLPHWGGLGVVFLMASDHIHVPLPTPRNSEEKFLQNITQFISILEGSGFFQFDNKMLRSYWMLAKCAEQLRGQKYFFDLPQLFEIATGVPLATYEALIFGALARFLHLDALKYTQDASTFGLPLDWFRNTSVPPEQIENFLKEISTSPEELANVLASEMSANNDFTSFRAKPLFRDNKLLFPFDFAFLAEKFDSAPFWNVHDSLSDGKKREEFHSFWGELFEIYVHSIFKGSVDMGINAFYPSPRYADHDAQVCDGIIVCGDSAILMEYKGNTFTAKAKYSYDPQKLGSEIERKLVGTDKKRKGVRQLADAVTALCLRTQPEIPSGPNLSRVTKFFPLLITRDDIGAAFDMNAYLNLRFKQLIGKKRKRFRKTVTPLFCLSAQDLEKIAAFLSDTRFTDILEAHYKVNPELRANFATVENPILGERSSRKPFLHKAAEEFRAVMFTQLGMKEAAQAAGT